MQTPRRYMDTSRVLLISRAYSLCLMLPLMSSSRTTRRTVAYSEGQGSWQDGPLPTLLPTTPQVDCDRRLSSLLLSWASSFNFSLFSTPLYPPSPLDLGGRKDCLRFSCLMSTIIWGTSNGHSSSSLGICFGFLAVALFWGDWRRTYISPRPVSGEVLKRKILTQDPQDPVLSTEEMYLLQRGKG